MTKRGLILALAVTTAVAASASAQEAESELIRQSRQVLNDASLDKQSLCSALNTSLFKLSHASGVESEERRTMKTLLTVRLSRAGCGGTVSVAIPDCASMVAALDGVKRQLVACRTSPGCTELGYLEPAFSMMFTESVKSCPRGDPRLAGLLGEVSVAVAPEQAYQRILELLKNGSLPSDEVASLIELIARRKDPKQSVRFLVGAIESLQCANLEDSATATLVADFLRSMSEAFSEGEGRNTAARRGELLQQLAKGGDVHELAQLLTAVDALKVQKNRRALRSAIDTLLVDRPELKDKLPPGSNPSLESTLVSLVGLLNAAEMAELLHNQEEASRWTLSEESTRRLPMVVATRLEPCLPSQGGPSDRECEAAMKIRVEFLKGVQGKAFFGAEAIEVGTPTADVLATAEGAMQERTCPTLPAGDPRQDAFCRGPFGGVLVLEVKKSGVEGKLVGQVSWLARTTNKKIARCSLNGTGQPCPAQLFDVSLPDAAAEAFRLGKRSLEECNIGKIGPKECDVVDRCRDCGPRRFGWAGAGYRAAAFSGWPWLEDDKPSNDWAGWVATAAEVGLVVGGAYYLHHGLDLRNDAANETGQRKDALLEDAARSVNRGTGLLVIGIPVTRVLSWVGYGATQ